MDESDIENFFPPLQFDPVNVEEMSDVNNSINPLDNILNLGSFEKDKESDHEHEVEINEHESKTDFHGQTEEQQEDKNDKNTDEIITSKEENVNEDIIDVNEEESNTNYLVSEKNIEKEAAESEDEYNEDIRDLNANVESNDIIEEQLNEKATFDLDEKHLEVYNTTPLAQEDENRSLISEEQFNPDETYEGLDKRTSQLKLNYVFDEVRRLLCDIDSDVQEKKKELSNEDSSFDIPITPKIKQSMSLYLPNISKKQKSKALKPLKAKSIPSELSIAFKNQIKNSMDGIQNDISPIIESSLKKNFDQNLAPSFQKSCSTIATNTHKQLFSNMNEYNHMIVNLCRQKSEQYKELKASKVRSSIKLNQRSSTLSEVKKLDELLQKKEYNEAFVYTLLKKNVSSLLDLCLRVNKSYIFNGSNSPLSQEVLLGIIQQFCSHLEGETYVKVEWINSSLEVLLSQNIKYNIDKYLDEMLFKLKKGFRQLNYSTQLKKEISYAIVNLQELKMN